MICFTILLFLAAFATLVSLAAFESDMNYDGKPGPAGLVWAIIGGALVIAAFRCVG